jgi:hypothetical protein
MIYKKGTRAGTEEMLDFHMNTVGTHKNRPKKPSLL